ncbi:7747_t:CDS:10 [Gigaspora margarita]|uniref:7747_t:CDS:1 n=1 Tax=Gigaspora margarita TaxID=4874 RepID=A0ABN7UQL2_GIGMA|nr:7747_t:CDS:10 [Gigaspora margarita]
MANSNLIHLELFEDLSQSLVTDTLKTPFTIAENAKKCETNILTNEKSAFSSTTSLDNIISLDRDQVISSNNLKWNPIWKITYSWLHLGKKKEKPALFYHQKLIKTRDKLQISPEIGFTNQLGTSHLSVIQNLVNTYWLAKNLVAISKINYLMFLTKYHVKFEIYILDYPLFESLEEESRADYRKFIDAIGRVIEKTVCQEIQESLFWSIMINETSENAISVVSYLAEYNDIVQSLYNYFSNSYLQMEHLKMIETQLEEPELHLLKIEYTISKTASILFDMIDQKFLLTTSFLADILKTTSSTEYGNKEIVLIANFYDTKVYNAPFIKSDNLIQEWKYS